MASEKLYRNTLKRTISPNTAQGIRNPTDVLESRIQVPLTKP